MWQMESRQFGGWVHDSAQHRVCVQSDSFQTPALRTQLVLISKQPVSLSPSAKENNPSNPWLHAFTGTAVRIWL